ncbi:MAG: hypothetical protein ACT4OK_04750 [Gemmobacter sp.]
MMPPGAGYPIEDFLEAITAQLDQTQDALRLKAVNRPLTFALKDFHVALKVFVEMDNQGRVTFRPAGPNEEGASTMSIGFTTITRPMIEENTISMEMAQAPTLAELGLAGDEQRQLAKIGVRNGAQLKNLQRSAGDDTLSRHTGVDLMRIRGALDLARPAVEDIRAEADPPSGFVPRPVPVELPPRRVNPVPFEPAIPRRPDPVPFEPAAPRRPDAVAPDDLLGRLRWGMVNAPEGPRLGASIADPVGDPPLRRLEIDPEARAIRVGGRNLIEGGRAPEAHLDGRRLDLREANTLAATFALPPGQGGGRLVIDLPDGRREAYDLVERPRGTPR